MFEDLLTDTSPSHRPPSFLDVPPTTDADTRSFFRRMATDIALAAADQPWHRARTLRALAEALDAAPAERAASWGRLYRQIASLIMPDPLDVPPAVRSADTAAAYVRLHQFVVENADLADTLMYGS